MVVPTGMPERFWVLVAPMRHELPVLSCVRSDPPVETKLMWPVSRTKRVIACAPASCALNSASSSNAKKHPRPLGPRMP
jgi:hypothetical protein